MRLATRRDSNGDERVCIVDGEELVDVAAPSLLDVVSSGIGRADLRTAAGDRVPVTEARLLSPIPHPRRNIVCVGWNFVAHFDEGRSSRTPDAERPEFPTFFTKATGTATGPFDVVPLHEEATGRLDWEVELGVVVGKPGRDMSRTEAADAVFGYLVANDISARDLQKCHGGQWFKGKSLDGTCPMGPWIVTSDELDPTEPLSISCTVDGEVKQAARTSDMAFDVPDIIAELSRGMTLQPGDVVLTGTPPGVGFARTPPEFLHAGAIIESEIESLGSLRNRVRAQAFGSASAAT